MDSEILIDWEQKTSNSLRRHKYEVLSLTDTDIFCKVLRIAYAKGLVWVHERCQIFFYMEVKGQASIICKDCIPSARYSVFSTSNEAVLTQYHAHSVSLASCLYCKKRMKSISLSKCKQYCNINKLFVSEKQWFSKIKK